MAAQGFLSLHTALAMPYPQRPHSCGLWEGSPTALQNPALKQLQQPGQEVPSLLRTWAFPAFLCSLAEAS